MSEYLQKENSTMNDIERRAHDLAIAMISVIYDRDYKGTDKRGGDAFEIYKDAYYQFLEDFKYNFAPPTHRDQE